MSTADFKLLLRQVTTNLKTLVATGNDIKAIGAAISPFVKLKTLNLANCALEYLTHHVCRSSPSLLSRVSLAGRVARSV